MSSNNIIASPEHYFGTELKVGFSETKLGDFSIRQREREGSVFNSFSHRLRVDIAPLGGVADVGDEILVQHFVFEQNPVIDKEYLIAYLEQIYAVKKRSVFDVRDKRYIENFDAVNGFLAYPHEVIRNDGFKHHESSQDTCEQNYALTFCGKHIEYTLNGDYEIFHQDKRVHYIMKEKCYLIDGDVNPDKFTEVYKEGDNYVNEEGNRLLIFNTHVFVSKKGRYFCLTSEIGGVVMEA